MKLRLSFLCVLFWFLAFGVHSASDAESDDCVITGTARAAQPNGTGGTKRRRKPQPCVYDEAPLQIITLISDAGHEWATAKGKDANALRKAIDASLVADDAGTLAERSRFYKEKGYSIVGFAVVRSWHFSFSGRSYNAGDFYRSKLALMQNVLRVGHRRSAQCGFIEIPIIASALLDVADGTDVQLSAESVTDLPSARRAVFQLAKDWLCQEQSSIFSPRSYDSAPVTVDDLFATWNRRYGIEGDHALPISYLTWGPLADCMVRGSWPLDVTAVVTKDRHRRRVADGLPPRSLEKLYLTAFTDAVKDLEHSQCEQGFF